MKKWDKLCRALCKTRSSVVTLVKGEPYKGYNKRLQRYRTVPFGTPIPEGATVVRRYVPKSWAERPVGQENFTSKECVIV